MICYIDATGIIIGGVYAQSPADLNGITRIPDGCTAVYVDDAQYPDVWVNMGSYIIQNGVPATRVFTQAELDAQLASAKSSKLESLQKSRDADIYSSFTSSALGSAKTYNYDLEAWTNFGRKASQLALSPTIASVTWANLEDGFVSHTRDQFIQVVMDGSTHEENLKMKYFNLEGQVNAATTIDAVNAIVW